ncbi:MAG: ABC transporter permease [Deltaproteobacteria bacterium]|nr:MAG: ABC transporter permease [Deltaproteobacteria bacterium]
MISFFTLLERELYRFGRLAAQTIAPPFVTTALFIVIFGYSLGQKIGAIAGFPYILFILPGLSGMSIITNSFSNSSSSLYMARMDRSIENILVAPISSFRIVLSFVVGGIVRGLTVGIVTMLTAYIMTDLTIHNIPLALLFVILISTIFSALGVIAALWGNDWEHLAAFSTFILAPLSYLGGTFYSIATLPPLWKKVSLSNPMYYMVDGYRSAILGHSDVSLTIALAFSSGLACITFLCAVFLFKKGYRIIV